jgi:Protein of unknown function (DUF1059)
MSVLSCECGYAVRASDEATLVLEAQRHAREAHRIDLTTEQVLLAAFDEELAGRQWPDGTGDHNTLGEQP